MVTARAPGLQDGVATFIAIGAGLGGTRAGPVQAAAEPAAVASVAADASCSGAPNTIPAAMLDGNASTYWSNCYLRTATALLPAASSAHAAEWAPGSGQPARGTFTPVSTSRIRVELTSRAPGLTSGFLGIAEMSAGRQ
jgi:beta-galactosidase